MTEPVRLEIRDGVATLTLDRPDKLNAIEDEIRAALPAAVRRIADDDSVRVAVVTGAGRAFSAGGSVEHFEREWNTAAFRRESRRLSDAFDEIEQMEKPVIAALNGIATGAGLQLALASTAAASLPRRPHRLRGWLLRRLGARLAL